MVHTGGTNQKKWVWVPCEKELYKPAYVLEEVNSRVKVQGDTVEEHQAVAVFRMNPPKFDQAENLSSLSYLNEPSVLHNIQTRYRDSLVYTYSGLFLLAVNPYRNMNIYSNEIKKKIIKEKRGESAPHIFSVANEAYRAMIANKENQSILITGESGAGKTENTKKVIEFLAFAASAGNEEFTASNNIENALMSANPLLEAFGNAKTVKNDNSSRFGKFVQVKFKEGKICGAKIEKYLLEKSRVMGTPAEERNFHIFYYLLAGASQELLSELFLVSNPSFYECLRNTQHKIHGVDDRKQFESLSQAFEELGISDPTPYYKTVAAILHISNVKVVEVNDRAVIDASNDGYRPIEIASDLLNVSCVDFINAVVNPVLKAGNELVVHYRTKEQAVSILEGFAKMLYESLFDVLISEINRQLDSTFDNYIGILDIAGFEIFKINSFEQLCINYTNEKLQQYFNHHMFILEQEIYKNEEIDWNFIDFGLDLEPTIRTIESSNPIGVLSYLDEECVMPCATDKTLLEKLRLVKGVDSPPFKDSFAIKHYAGKVEYEVNNWLRKNKDAESEALLLLVSENKRAGKGENTQFIKKGSFKTVAQSHREGLRWLMDTLKGTQPHFVRCILPNLLKTSDNFNKRLVLDQLRCNGVLEGIRISRLGYPTRIAFNEFNDRYGFIGGIEKEEDAILPKERSISLINRLMLNKNGYRVGRTMVFFRQGVIADLEDLRERRMTKLAGVVQEMVRIKIAVKKESLDKDRLEAIRHLQRNAGLSVKLLKWKWWYLFLKVQPLLDVKRAENDKKKLQEQIDLRREALEKVEKEKEEKEKENGRLQMMLEALRAELSRKESELMDKEGLLESLRNDNSRISSYVAALKESEESIGILKESLSQLSSKNEANVEMKKELERQHAILKEEFEKKKNELDLMISQDLGNVLCSKEEELGELRRKLVNAEKRYCEVSKQNESLSASVDRKNKECEMLNENEMKQEIELCTLKTELDRLGVEMACSVASRDDAIAKLEQEIADLQLENDGLESRCIQMEGVIQSDENMIKGLNQDLNYQKVRNSGLEASIQVLKNMKVVENEKVPDKTEAEDTLVLNKALNSLKAKLANEQKINAKLVEEKDALYEENVKLMQSKLDDLFSTETEFNMAKSAMQSEIRRLEADNATLKSELMAVQSTSDYSDDSGFERMALLLEEERKQRKTTDMRIVELENRNLKLETQLSSVNEELAESERRNNDIRKSLVVRTELSNLKKELSATKKSLSSISTAFQANFFDILAKKDQYYSDIVSKQSEEISNQNMKISKLEETRHQYENLLAVYEELKKRYSIANNELEALTVENKMLQTGVKEHKQHISRLEEAYNDRELVVGEMKSKYSEALEEMNDCRMYYLDSIKQIKEQTASKYNKEFNEAMQMIKKASAERIAELTSENEALRGNNNDVIAKLHRMQTENEELNRLVESLSQSNSMLDKKMEDLGPILCSERLVSTFVVDKNAFKASEWKSLVDGKCQRCAEIKFEPSVSSSNAEMNKLSNEIRELKLKLGQSERVAEENQKIIETMRSCMESVRRSKGLENK